MYNLSLREPGILILDGQRFDIRVTSVSQDFGSNEVEIEGYLVDSFRTSNLRARKANKPSIVRVIFNDPATIVIWSDKTKTVVKCQPGDTFDKGKGLAMAIAKKFYGNQGNYNEVFKKWLDD